MDREDYRGTLMKLEAKQTDTYIRFMRTLPLFEKWGYSSLFKLLFAVDRIHVKRGEIIYEQGHEADAFFIIYQGEFHTYKKVKISYSEKESIQNMKDKRDSPNYGPMKFKMKESIVSIMEPGYLFGVEEAFISDLKSQEAPKKYLSKVVCASEKGILMKFCKAPTFGKLIYHDDTLKLLTNMKTHNLEVSSKRSTDLK